MSTSPRRFRFEGLGDDEIVAGLADKLLDPHDTGSPLVLAGADSLDVLRQHLGTYLQSLRELGAPFEVLLNTKADGRRGVQTEMRARQLGVDARRTDLALPDIVGHPSLVLWRFRDGGKLQRFDGNHPALSLQRRSHRRVTPITPDVRIGGLVKGHFPPVLSPGETQVFSTASTTQLMGIVPGKYGASHAQFNMDDMPPGVQAFFTDLYTPPHVVNVTARRSTPRTRNPRPAPSSAPRPRSGPAPRADVTSTPPEHGPDSMEWAWLKGLFRHGSRGQEIIKILQRQGFNRGTLSRLIQAELGNSTVAFRRAMGDTAKRVNAARGGKWTMGNSLRSPQAVKNTLKITPEMAAQQRDGRDTYWGIVRNEDLAS